MTRPNTASVREAVTMCVSRLMTRSGHTGHVSAESDVIRGLGLTSEDGVELACMLEAALDIRIPHDANPLVEESNGHRQSRTIQQVCDAVSVWAASGDAK